MPYLIDGLQLVGFLVVNIVILAALVRVAIGLAVFFVHDRPKARDRQERTVAHESNIPAAV